MPDVFEIIESCRAMRRLKPDPVPDELIAQILQKAADKAPEPDHYRRTAMDMAPEKDTGKRFRNATHPSLKPTDADRIEMALRRLEFALGRPSRGASY